MAGRPTKLTPEVETDLVLLLSNGLSICSAARVVGVSRRSLTRWLADGMAERVAEARASRPRSTDALTEARMVVALAKAAALGDWRAAAWMLERRWPVRRRQSRPRLASDGGAAYAETPAGRCWIRGIRAASAAAIFRPLELEGEGCHSVLPSVESAGTERLNASLAGILSSAGAAYCGE
jgi:hypothetical protein